MIDRCQALWVLKYVLKLPIAFDSQSKRKGLFLSVGGTGFSNLFEPSLAIIKSFFTVLDISLAGQVTYRKIDAAGDILKHPEALQEAFNAGKTLVNEK
ncbi:MAG: hypothetical protein U1D67_06935 [Dehalococcoidia bacterium]|nr:hypothetical protein [Dehalococcoidia bacterium]